MNPAEKVARALQKRGLLRYLPVTFLKHYVYPLTVRRPTQRAHTPTYWESWYQALPEGEFSDRQTISPTCDPVHSRLHYAATEIALLGWFARSGVSPRRVLDIGSGAGHWLRMYRDTFGPDRLMAAELSTTAVGHLSDAFADAPEVEARQIDISEAGVDLGETFDVINAIGVMFHIVEDARWETALGNIARHLEPGGHAVIGGQFGLITRDVQFHNQDAFTDWDAQKAAGDVAYVDKRIRSLRHWRKAASRVGLSFVEVVRTQRVPEIVQPESHILVLRRG